MWDGRLHLCPFQYLFQGKTRRSAAHTIPDVHMFGNSREDLAVSNGRSDHVVARIAFVLLLVQDCCRGRWGSIFSAAPTENTQSEESWYKL